MVDVQVDLPKAYYNKISGSMHTEKLAELLEDFVLVIISRTSCTSIVEGEAYNCRAKLPDLKQTSFMCLLLE